MDFYETSMANIGTQDDDFSASYMCCR